ncbi:MAG: flavin reductase [Parasporobacterium sp.]|nr:flavin reductase [Parasporobacterium sp.]
MKEKIRLSDYAGIITEALPKGILLNTMADKFNSMVIGWGHLGTLWGKPTFAVYVRQSRYTKKLLDEAGEFTVSTFVDRSDPDIFRVCGTMSGRDVDKVKEAGLTLEEPEVINTPGIREYPLTLECRVLYVQDQDVEKLPEDIRSKMYPETEGKTDFHTMYVGEIVDAYIIR